MKKYLAGIFLCAVFGNAAQAALVSRASGAAYYDTVLDITWLADANLADTNDFGVTGITANGSMTWDKAGEWIAAMNAAVYLGVSNWRLPTVTDTGASGCNFAFTGTDCGYNVDLSTGEMANLYYSTLGNVAYFNTSGSMTGCSEDSPYCLTNAGPFSNIQPQWYWTGTTFAPSTSNAWIFNFYAGGQDWASKGGNVLNAWAVSPGDTLSIQSAVPVPAAVWLFGGALGALGIAKRRAKSAA